MSESTESVRLWAKVEMTERELVAYTKVIVKGGHISIHFECGTSEWIVAQSDHEEPIIGIADTLFDALEMAYESLDLEQQNAEQDEPPPTTRDAKRDWQ